MFYFFIDSSENKEKIISNKIFIVHGRNENIKNEVELVVMKLGLDPIILHQQPNHGKTIIEKFEKYSDVGFAIIILTADDKGGYKTDDNLNFRARQNVILEMGYFIANWEENGFFLFMRIALNYPVI